MLNNTPAQDAALIAAHEIEQVCIKHKLPLFLLIAAGEDRTLCVNHLMEHSNNRAIIMDNFQRSMEIIMRKHP